MKIAIVGAGMAGLACADRLGQDGHEVMLFDKSRGAGGRMSTRRVATATGEVAFDHGAQYFTARDPLFVEQLQRWQTDGIAAPWPAAGPDAWVGIPGMSAPVRALSDAAAVRWQCRIGAFTRHYAGWTLDTAPHAFDAMVVATPAEQAVPLLTPHDPVMAAMAASCVSAPCWTAMAAFAVPVAITPDIIRAAGPIGWAARNSAKPGRAGAEAWVVQATPAWSREHLEEPADTVADALLAALAEQAGGALPDPILRMGHRWRYARTTAIEAGCAWNSALRLGAVGDWLIGPRVESAWLSGQALAERIGAQR